MHSTHLTRKWFTSKPRGPLICIKCQVIDGERRASEICPRALTPGDLQDTSCGYPEQHLSLYIRCIHESHDQDEKDSLRLELRDSRQPELRACELIAARFTYKSAGDA